jgi:hypothetical protein
MKLKFNGGLEVKPIEWLPIAIFIIVVFLLITGKTNEAIQFVKDCWLLVKK